MLEDVELAFVAKRRKVGLRFRYAPDALSTRMYRTTAAMIEGWTKNLALLFNNTLATALWKALDIVLLVGLPWLAIHLWNARFSAHSLEWLGAGWVLLASLVANPVSLLCAGREIEFSICRLRHFSAGIAPVCRALVSQLVQASGSEAGKLEGKDATRDKAVPLA